MNISDIFHYVQDGGVIGILVFILVAGYRGWWVFGRQLADAEARCLEWKAMALRNIEANERALEIAQAMQGLVRPLEPPPRPPGRLL